MDASAGTDCVLLQSIPGVSTARANIPGRHVTGEGSLFDVPPAAIGRFRVLHQLGAGTCGPVFRAVDPETDTPVAVKLFTAALPPDRSRTLADGLVRLVGELPRMTAVVAPLAAGLEGHTPYLATFYAGGDSLDVALKQFGPAVLVDLVPRLRALGAALDEAAGRQLLHGALHPRDVIVSESDTALTGLGIWPLLAALGERLPMRRPYRAPDLGPGGVSAAGDRFSLAAMAYEWATGRRAPSAFVPGDMAAVPGGHRAALGEVFGRALHADPDRRYESCLAFVDDLAAIAHNMDAPPPAEGGAVPGRRRPPAVADLALPLGDDSDETDLALSLSAPPELGEADASPPEEGPLAMGRSPNPVADEEGGDEDASEARDEVTERADEVSRSERGVLTAVPGRGETLGPLVDERPTGPASWDTRRTDAAPARPAMGRLAVAAALGVVLGLGVGYLTWGRVAPAGSSPAATAEPARPAEPVVVAEPEIVPTGPAPSSDSPPEGGEAAGAAAGAPTPSAPGSLLIRSIPAGATVYVDEERRGITPLTLTSVELGTRVVRLQRDGFVPDQRQVTLSEDRPSRSVDVRLRRVSTSPGAVAPSGAGPAAAVATTGSLVVESRPAGAEVTVDGRRRGVTPMTLDRMAPGTHTVTLSLTGFRPVTATVRVVAGERARAAASLTRLQEP